MVYVRSSKRPEYVAKTPSSRPISMSPKRHNYYYYFCKPTSDLELFSTEYELRFLHIVSPGTTIVHKKMYNQAQTEQTYEKH